MNVMKKQYIAPDTRLVTVETAHFVMTSQLNNTLKQQEVTFSEEETDEFNARTYHSVWDDEE